MGIGDISPLRFPTRRAQSKVSSSSVESCPFFVLYFAYRERRDLILPPRIRFVPASVGLVLLALPQGAYCQSVQVTITSDPPFQNFTMQGQGCSPGTYRSPQTLAWTVGAKCTATWLLSSATPGARYIFERWEDSRNRTREPLPLPARMPSTQRRFPRFPWSPFT